MLEDSYFEPKGADFLLWGLVSPLACGGFSVSRQGFQTTKPRQSTRIHLLQSGSGAEREDSKLAWGQQVAPLAPRRQLRTPGKSFWLNNYILQSYELGRDVMIIDIGGSYRSMSMIIKIGRAHV